MMNHKQLPGVLVVVLAFAPGCRAPEPTHHVRTEILPHLAVIQPVRAPWFRKIDLAATIEAAEKVDLTARVPGIVDKLSPDMDIGRQVVAGEVLLSLAVPDLEGQKAYKLAVVEQARRALVQAGETQKVAARELAESIKQEEKFTAELRARNEKHTRTNKLVKTEALQPELAEETQFQLRAADSAAQAARAQIETRQAKLKLTAADIEVARSKVQVAEAEVRNSDVSIAYATIRAPFNGVITKRWVDRGATIKDPGTMLLTVMRTDVVRVLMDVPERDVPAVMRANKNAPKGNYASLHVPALPDKVFSGGITRTATALDPITRTMRTEMHVENKDGDLRPGMYGTVTIEMDSRKAGPGMTIIVPSTAISVRNGKPVVFVVANTAGDPPRGVIHSIEVELGMDDGDRVEVRKGLKGTELVVAKGSGVVRMGESVIAVPAREP
jgi:HlyD family secretion protein